MKWWHSLYWRIAAGFVACLAVLLAVQAILFVWVVARSASTIPNQPPDRVAQTIASDASQALERDASLDLERYLRQEYGRDAQPFFAVLPDGHAIEIGASFPPPMIEEARQRLARMHAQGTGPPERGFFGRGEPFAARGGRGGPGPSRRGRGFAPGMPAPIVADGRVAALVVVPPRPPFTFLFARYAPILGSVAIATLVVGAAIATLVIFGAPRKRLRAREDAARRLGSGDFRARAPADGHDEVSAVARAFNGMADELSNRAEALAASDRARRQLLADVSHELTTPVTAMRGYLETLRMPELDLDEAARARYLTILGDETARLERIIGDLLDLAKLEGGGGPLIIEDVSVQQLFERVVTRHERPATDAGVTMTMTIAPGAAMVRGDRDRLEQALQNLAANALRYAPSGSTIDLGARRDGHDVAITLTDHGAGIAREHLPRVFDRFYKADPSRAIRHGTGPTGGSGLGLSIVKTIVERHGGMVAVQSEPGRTRFELRIRN